MKTTLKFGRCKTQIRDATTDKVIKESGWTKNLVFDSGLNLLANSTVGSGGFPFFFEYCSVGSGTSPNAIASGAITFSQVGTAITSSSGFFTSTMNGAILKYGTGSGGQEVYLTYINSTTATASISYSISSSVGTVWQVQKTALDSFLYNNASIDTSTGACSTIFAGNLCTMQVTFKFAVQASPYSVNEIGYGSAPGATCNGRFVLGSTDVVSPSQYYVVIMQMGFAASPGAPTAVLNVGTTVNTAGTVMFQAWDLHIINSSGNGVEYQTNYASNIMEGGGPHPCLWTSTAMTLNTSIQATQLFQQLTGYVLPVMPNISHGANPVGVGTSSLTFSQPTAGETMTALIFGFSAGSGAGAYATHPFVLNLTTPYVLPVGTFAGTLTVTWIFSRTLSN